MQKKIKECGLTTLFLIYWLCFWNVIKYYHKKVRKTVNGKKYKYSYPISGWRDQLLSFNGEECKYDALGNPLSYKGRTLTWQGRRLISYGIENKKATYTYDFNNVRTSKTATDGTTSVTSKYIYDE